MCENKQLFKRVAIQILNFYVIKEVLTASVSDLPGKSLLFFVQTQAGVAPGIFDGGLTHPMRGLKYGFQGTINAKIYKQIAFHLPMGG